MESIVTMLWSTSMVVKDTKSPQGQKDHKFSQGKLEWLTESWMVSHIEERIYSKGWEFLQTNRSTRRKIKKKRQHRYEQIKSHLPHSVPLY